MRFIRFLLHLSICIPALLTPLGVLAEDVSAPQPQPASIVGTAIDIADNPIPNATVDLDGATPADHLSTTANDNGFFVFRNLKPGVAYHVTVRAKGFADWTSSAITLAPGQDFELTGVQLKLSVVETTVAAESTEEIATEQVEVEEKQRVLGIIPNFFVVYDLNPAPLTVKLKYRLSLKAATDVVTFGGAVFLATINQAADTPSYKQGWAGYGQRVGAAYADGATDILIGGAILPSILHQDPRYFYQGTGSNKSRARHALLSPFICKGDNGQWQFNYSSVGGDLASGALSEIYYPTKDRGPGLVFSSAAITTAGRMANALAQEFILRRLTPSAKNKN